MTLQKPTVGRETCQHPPSRYYCWTAYDGTVIVCCCDCGKVLHGAVVR